MQMNNNEIFISRFEAPNYIICKKLDEEIYCKMGIKVNTKKLPSKKEDGSLYDKGWNDCLKYIMRD